MKKATYMQPKTTMHVAMYEKEAMLASSVTNGTDPITVNPGGGDQGAGRAKSASFFELESDNGFSPSDNNCDLWAEDED